MVFFLVSLFWDLLARVTRPWRQIFWLALHLYMSVCDIVLNRVSETFSSFIEVTTAYRRVKELERRLSSLGRDHEEEKLRNSELQRKLDAFTKDRRRIMETLDLVNDEKKKAVDTVRFLINKIQDLEYTNQELAENEETLRRGLAKTGAALTSATERYSEKLSSKQNNMNFVSMEYDSILQAKELASKTLHDDLNNDSYLQSWDEMQSLVTQGSSLRQIGSEDSEDPLFSESDKGLAFVSSIFSAFLSTLVAMIAWEAKDPCTPLVIALFTVVCVSLANVVRFLSKPQSHRGFVAVALLSLNWFVMGTLAHPAMPYLGQMGSGVVYVIGSRLLRILGFGNVIRAVKAASDE